VTPTCHCDRDQVSVIATCLLAFGDLKFAFPFAKGEDEGEGLFFCRPRVRQRVFRKAAPDAPHLNPLSTSGARRTQASAFNVGR
jgi:hypothetical protein